MSFHLFERDLLLVYKTVRIKQPHSIVIKTNYTPGLIY